MCRSFLNDGQASASHQQPNCQSKVGNVRLCKPQINLNLTFLDDATFSFFGFNFSVLSCSSTVLMIFMSRHENHTVRVRKGSGFGLKYPFKSPQTWRRGGDVPWSPRKYQDAPNLENVQNAGSNCSRRLGDLLQPSPPPLDITVRSQSCNANVMWYIMWKGFIRDTYKCVSVSYQLFAHCYRCLCKWRQVVVFLFKTHLCISNLACVYK